MRNVLFEELIERVVEKAIPVKVDSRKVEKGDIFVSLPVLEREFGMLQKQIDYMYSAGKKNASVLLCNNDTARQFAKAYPQYQQLLLAVDDSRKALGNLARVIYHTEQNSFPLIGITGTNGKTTLTYLAEYFFTAMGKKVGVIGTVSYRYPGYELDAPLTTPDCLFLHSFFHDMQKKAMDYGIMEVSSHAIDQNRIAGLEFDAAVFTNLTQDHLDYHPNMEDYFASKSQLFTAIAKKDKKCIINADDAYGLRLLENLPDSYAYTLHNVVTPHKTLFGTVLIAGTEGLTLKLNFEEQEYVLKTPLIGEFNASNILAVVALGLSFGYSLKDFACLGSFNGVCGRLERIDNRRNVHAFVDYAHTPDALINVLKALRKNDFEEIITVFGCGGDRDKTKRPRMAQAVSAYSDIIVLTSDNPRTENPEAILDDIEKGIDKNKDFHRIPDRRKALEYALELVLSKKNKNKTALLVAGKGHETYQIIGTTKYPFSDQLIIKEALL